VNALPSAFSVAAARRKRTGGNSRTQPGALNLSTAGELFANGNILDILMSAVHGAQIRVAEQAGRRRRRPAGDCIDAQWHDFNHPAIIDVGDIPATLGRLKPLVLNRPAA